MFSKRSKPNSSRLFVKKIPTAVLTMKRFLLKSNLQCLALIPVFNRRKWLSVKKVLLG